MQTRIDLYQQKLFYTNANRFITTKVLNKIKEFVTINYQVISDYSDYLISTEDLLTNLKKV